MCFSCEATDFQEGRGVKIVVGRLGNKGRKVLKMKSQQPPYSLRAVYFSPCVCTVKRLPKTPEWELGIKEGWDVTAFPNYLGLRFTQFLKLNPI